MFLTVSQHVNLVLANIGFQIAAADALSTIAASVCRANNTPAAQCWDNQPVLTVVVGGAQLLLSQMKNLQAARMTSAVGGVAAFVYCVITFVLAGSRVSVWQESWGCCRGNGLGFCVCMQLSCKFASCASGTP
jgi:hypothetical protein